MDFYVPIVFVVLWCGVGLILLIVCVNLSNLLLSSVSIDRLYGAGEIAHPRAWTSERKVA
jgi:hypothetical protein